MKLAGLGLFCFLVFSPWFSGVLRGAEELRLNQLQAIGSHNSYHLAPPAAVLGVIGKFREDAVDAWNYSHPRLGEQLSVGGLRQLELDVFADTRGGLFSNPLGPRLAGIAGAKLPAFDAAGHLAKPGFKILHVQDIDCWSHTPTLELALGELSGWSLKNPGHLPVMVLIECKDEEHPPLPTRPEVFSGDRLLELEQAILKGIPRGRLFLPDDLRGDEPTMREAIRKNGWPRIAEVRGKFLFALDNGGKIRDRYLEGNAALRGRVMFVSAPEVDHPAAAWFKRNDPVREFEEIQRLVKAGFLVRTRADSGGPDAVQRERAFASGAHWVSTDHFAAEVAEDERVVFPGGAMVRPNPLTAEGVGLLKP